MKIDRKRISSLCAMNDRSFYGAVKFFAGANGIDISKKRVAPGEIANLKRALSTLSDSDIVRINEFLHICKYGR